MKKTLIITLSILFTAALAYAGAIVVPRTTADLPDTTDKRYATDAEKAALSSIPSITAAVESTVTDTLIKSKLGPASDSQDGYTTKEDHETTALGLLQHWATLGGALPLTQCPPTQQVLDAAAALGFDQNHIFCVIFPVGGVLTGSAANIGIGQLAGAGAGNVSMTGSALQQGIGSLSALSFSTFYATLSGVGAQYALGGLAGHGNGTATLVGFANTAALGQVSGVAGATVAIFGVAQNIALGTLTGHGDGNRTLTGIAQAEVMGSVTGTATGGGSSGIATVSVSNGGSGYVINDVLTVADGTSGTVTVTAGPHCSEADKCVDDQCTNQSDCESQCSSQWLYCSGGIASCTDDCLGTWLGAVTGASFPAPGTGYSTGVHSTTGGTGSSCTINVLTLQ